MITRTLFQTTEEKGWPSELAVTAARVFTGLAMAFGHGLGKMPPSPKFVEDVGALGFPQPELFAWAASLAEFAGGILLALGLLTRPSAAFIAFTMLVAAFGRHSADPFKGKELALLYFALTLICAVRGAGRLSLDHLLWRGLSRRSVQTTAAATATTAALVALAALPSSAAAQIPAAAPASGSKSVLMIVTSADRIDQNHPTGLWLEEFAVPWLEFTRAGLRVDVASPAGEAAPVPVDPRSKPTPEKEQAWAGAKAALEKPLKLDASLSADAYDAIFICGGHGAMIDLVNDTILQALLGEFARQGKAIGAVCHGPAALVNVRGADGRPLVAGKRLTAFTDLEEREVKLDTLMPFLLESRLKQLGARFVAREKFQAHSIRDGNLITGQNPASSRDTAWGVLEALRVSIGR